MVQAAAAIRALRLYLSTKTSSPIVYVASELLQGLLSWVPGIVGIAIRGLCYKLVLRAEGLPAIEHRVSLHRVEDISLGRGVYLDTNVVLHGAPGGLVLGRHVSVMNGSSLNVHNFRGLPHAGIRIGDYTYLGDGCVIRGQGGVDIGERVLFGPRVLVMAVEHVFSDPSRAPLDQGITARGIRIEDHCWIGAGAIVLDGVTIGRGSVIGAGAVVTRSIPPASLAVGAPARVVRDLAREAVPPEDGPVYFGGLDDR